MKTVRLTMAQALVRYLVSQKTQLGGSEVPLIAGVWAIFGHGNVAGIGEALHGARETLPTWRGHNEQSMAHAAIAFAKAKNRRQWAAVTTSIGPGATNLTTAAATAHVNRLPLLLLPGDIFANRRPDPVLQQLEDFGDPNITANDCLRPVSRFWDRITRPEQLLASLPQAISVLTDPADCGPVTLALPQDVQTEAYDFPEHFFAERIHRLRRPPPDQMQLEAAVDRLRQAEAPLIIAGGGVHYSAAGAQLADFAKRHGVPVAETQAGKGALSWHDELNVGAVGVTGTAAANALAEKADVVLAVGSRLSDFTTASRSLFQHPDWALIQLNVGRFDALKHGALSLVADAHAGLAALDAALGDWTAPESWTTEAKEHKNRWNDAIDTAIAPGEGLPTDAQVLGAVNRIAADDAVVVCAAGGLPGELHKLWRVNRAGGYHLEYGYSCMGYEIAGGLGVKMAKPDAEVWVLVGDGSYLMMNSEIVTAAAEGHKVNLVILDNHGFGCINRLQQGTGGAPFKNLLTSSGGRAPSIDFAAHARALGAQSEKVDSLAELPEALQRAKHAASVYAVVIETDPQVGTDAGGAWWDVAVPETSVRKEVQAAHDAYEKQTQKQRIGRV